MKYYVWGVLATGSLMVAMFFLHYWRSSRERLFVFFSAAFALMALQWTASALSGTDEARHAYLLILRILAFVCIIAGVLERNRRDRRR
jgi:Family of unknown function (DUF5985)